MNYIVDICHGIIAIDLSKIGDMPIHYAVGRAIDEYRYNYDKSPVIRMNAYTVNKVISSLPIQWYNINETIISSDGYKGMYCGYHIETDEAIQNDVIYLETTDD